MRGSANGNFEISAHVKSNSTKVENLKLFFLMDAYRILSNHLIYMALPGPDAELNYHYYCVIQYLFMAYLHTMVLILDGNLEHVTRYWVSQNLPQICTASA